MPKLLSSAPRYRRHKSSGQAVVRLEDRDIYLGKHGTAASREAYRRFVAEWFQNGGDLPAPLHTASVTEVIVSYVEFATGYCKGGKPTDELRLIKTALKIVRELYGRTPAAKLGPLALKACREQMIARDWCRTHINKQVDRVKRAFKWAAENEMIPGTVYQALRCVAGLKRGRTTARERSKVKPVPDADVLATLEHLNNVVAAMVQLQRLCGARPSELCSLRPCDLNRTADPWEFTPSSHKCEHHDRPRVIFLGPKSQQILLPYLLRAADEFCFSPREAENKRRASQHKDRRTPISCGNRPGSNRKTTPRRTAGLKYDRNSYARAIRRAAEKAGVSAWSPNRLRHSFASEIRRTHGLEAAQVLLGHSKATTTEIYAERDFVLAARVSREVG